MHAFHPIHGNSVVPYHHHTKAVITEELDDRTLFSRDPIQHGDSFTVRVTQAVTETWVSVIQIEMSCYIYNTGCD